MNDPEPSSPRPETTAIRAGRSAAGSSLATPIWPSTAYEFASVDESAAMAMSSTSTRFYARNGTPTVADFAAAVAETEGAEAGLAFGSGMGAVSTVVLAFCSAGDRIVAQRSMFSVTAQLLSRVCPRFDIEVDFVDAFDSEALRACVAERPTQLVWVETPANPTLGVVDLDAVGGLAGPFTVVDSTVATPAVQRPLDYGVDLVVHSATKAIAGHNDALLGVVVGNRDLVDVVWGHHVMHGAVASPFDAFLGLRGLRSLFARNRQQAETAAALAERLTAHPAVASVHYPGLETHPQRAVARRQMASGGSILSIDLAGGLDAGRKLIERVELARPGLSLGGPETLVTHAATMIAATMAPEDRATIGITDGLVRISVGLEHVDDLLADLETAL